ncbi:NfeD family protein [Fuchsiella alkaliacetigena]|uniref:NfeD family protein n=1 Tax=Fuchsiella alkaliacetigena TaxID=957042 RepID=UPI00200AD1CE|nr:NfeD family protein [Fuchsiella alkaliacetigena]MCK8825155.1 ATP-dependent Clp protease proteolytic subunit [Fuchsiella alkaliacetigena]
MEKAIRSKLLIIVLIILVVFLATTALETELSAQDTEQQLIYHLPIHGDIDLGLASFVDRGVATAEAEGASALLVSVDSFGGLVKAGTQIRDRLLATQLPVVVYVRGRAWSAGALIALAGDELFMERGSSIGAAEPSPDTEKNISALRKEFQSTAERTGRDPQLAAAMVDADLEIEGVVEAGKILSLSASEAKELGFIQQVVANQSQALEEAGYTDYELQRVEPNLRENLASFTSNPVVSTILLTVGFMALVIEAITLGWGGAGSVGLLSLGLFFTGRLIAGTTGVGLLLLFLLGVFLLALEVLVVPGFGVTGVGGIAAIITSLFFTFENQEVAVYVLSISVVASILGLVIFIKYFLKSSAWSRIELATELTTEKGYRSSIGSEDLIGKLGRTVTPLRPAGIAEIEGRRIDVVSEGGFVPAEEEVKVVSARGSRVVVKEVNKNKEEE